MHVRMQGAIEALVIFNSLFSQVSLFFSLLNDNATITCSLGSLSLLSALTTLTHSVCHGALAVAHSLIGGLLAPCRNELSKSTCSDLVSPERSGPVPALEKWCVCVCPAVAPMLGSFRKPKITNPHVSDRFFAYTDGNDLAFLLNNDTFAPDTAAPISESSSSKDTRGLVVLVALVMRRRTSVAKFFHTTT